MTVKPRTMIVAATLIATGSLSVAALLAGGTATAAAPAAPSSVAAEVQAAPVVVVPAAAPTTRTVVAHAVHAVAPVRHTATVVRHVTVAAPVRKPVAVAPVAPKPAAKPVVAPAPAPKPAPAPAPTTSVRDDYPFRTATTNDSDTWGFTKRQCVSFAAFRLSQHGHAIDNGTQNWGSALTWDDAAKRLGKTVTTSPKVGAIAQWNAGESSSVYSSTGAKKGTFSAGSYGHVGYVAAVYGDGSVLVEQYNLGGDRSYSAMRMSAPRYIVF